jgi:hypothetical protein
MRNAQTAKGLMDLIHHIKSSPRGSQILSVLEIGSFSGESTVLWCANFPEVHAVDPWDYEGTEIALPEGHDFTEVERAFDFVCIYYSETLTKHKMRSHDLLKEWAGTKYVDVVYIDGDHSYEGVLRDISDSLLVCNEWICGHDYDDPRYPGVRQAVDEMFSHVVLFRDKSWAVRL